MQSGGTASAKSKIYALKSSDGDIFEVEEAVAIQSLTLKALLDDECDQGKGSSSSSITALPNVSTKVLAKVLQYCKRHADPHLDDDDDGLKAFDAEFIKVDPDMLFQIISAADYLNIKKLLDLSCETVAEMIKGKNADEIRKFFKIKNDFSPREEEELRRENAWAFE